MTNAGPEMAPWGGIDAIVGTNPVGGGDSVRRRSRRHAHHSRHGLTMAGKGMMRWLMRDGRKMPTTWALTPDGRTTDDPAAAMDGTLLPMGDYKGYGLSLVTDVLTGVLGGGAFGTVPYSDPARQDVSHQFIAYDIDWFMARAEFYGQLAEFIAMVKSSRTRPGVKEILLPGELEWRRMQSKKQSGVPVDPEIYAELRELAGYTKSTGPSKIDAEYGYGATLAVARKLRMVRPLRSPADGQAQGSRLTSKSQKGELPLTTTTPLGPRGRLAGAGVDSVGCAGPRCGNVHECAGARRRRSRPWPRMTAITTLGDRALPRSAGAWPKLCKTSTLP